MHLISQVVVVSIFSLVENGNVVNVEAVAEVSFQHALLAYA